MIDNLLLVGRDASIAETIREVTANIYSADDVVEAAGIIRTTDVDAIVIDPSVAPDRVCGFVQQLRRRNDLTPVIAVSDAEELLSQSAGDCQWLGAAIATDKLLPMLRQITSRSRRASTAPPVSDSPALEAMVGSSPAMNQVRRMIRMVAQSGCNPVLIIGETGTGKELAARSVHEFRHGNTAKF
ncbi:MAG TPA: sigma 54-interacting transcriptional regulator, partial [Sedimentisphaerales bacterium]|nr:sigma 54-interacting transcriptional regulator [Sedimentisphaerales bacterium]